MKKYWIQTYGCQMNESDSEKIAFLLEKAGNRPAKDEASANLIVVNICSVRQSAVDRALAKINKYYKTKEIILAGCLLPSDRKKLKNKVAEFWPPDRYFVCPPEYCSKSVAFLPIMTGCNNFCSYCVVPYTRGKESSKKAEKIIREAKSLIKKDYKEIILLGQNVNSYRDEKLNFPKLLKKINDLKGNFRLNFITSHPKDMSDELIEAMAECQKLAKELHLPLQSGDNQILKKMNRHYTAGHYENLIKKIRQKMPTIKISTDIIVDFPGETGKQFANTVKLVKALKFNKAYIAKYSPRPVTSAFKLRDNVSPREKKRRWEILEKLINRSGISPKKRDR
jgi:tRNA-2-methylthio-N6-dimethylallyladenosine synthase